MALEILVNSGSGNGLVPTNVDFSSVKSCGIHLRTLSQEGLKIAISKTKIEDYIFKSTLRPPESMS